MFLRCYMEFDNKQLFLTLLEKYLNSDKTEEASLEELLKKVNANKEILNEKISYKR